MPSYVLEYLLGRYCASDDPEEIRLGMRTGQNGGEPYTAHGDERAGPFTC